MKEIKLEELKAIQIEILDVVHHFCQENGITYFLSSGSLIGAVRHKGYIPWDDDIDLYMPRKDYDCFMSIFNKDNRQRYRVVSLQTDDNCTLAFAKVERTDTRIIEHVDNPMELGINIDIFPVDGVPDDMEERTKYFTKIQRIRDELVIKDVLLDFKKRGLIKNLILLLGKLFLFHKSMRQLAEQLDMSIDKSNLDSQYVCNLVMGNGINSVFTREAINDSTDVEFEGKFYKTMRGYEEYLTKTYGNYMLLPPIEKRVSHHVFTAYWV